MTNDDFLKGSRLSCQKYVNWADAAKIANASADDENKIFRDEIPDSAHSMWRAATLLPGASWPAPASVHPAQRVE
jgi:hypothetical protein